MSLDFGLTYTVDRNNITVFDINITHNLNTMASEAGIYYALWHPEERYWYKASDIVEVLKKGLDDLKARPEHYEQFNAENGWGLYEHFVPFVEEVWKACRKYPNAKISVSR